MIQFCIEFTFKSLPIMFSNMTPVAASKLLPKLNFPIDFGIKLKDNERLFGKNKTYRGIISALMVGSFLGIISPYITVVQAFLLSAGTMIGDLITSFIKRRIKLKPGEDFEPWESIIFIPTALMMVPGLFSLKEAVLLIFVSLFLYPFVNWITYKLKIKKEYRKRKFYFGRN